MLTKMLYNSETGIRFRSIIKGKNIMTPDVLCYYQHKKQDVIIEVTEGTGFKRNPIWGITVITDGVPDNERSNCVFSLEELEQELKNLH